MVAAVVAAVNKSLAFYEEVGGERPLRHRPYSLRIGFIQLNAPRIQMVNRLAIAWAIKAIGA
jgi:hypothetical protein